MRTRPVHGNCFFGLLYLLLRGKVCGIVAVSTIGGWWPWHFIVEGRRGALHFHPVAAEHEANPKGPWWFLGSFEGFSYRRAREELARSGRRILWRLDGSAAVWLLAGLMFAVLFFPYLLCWTLWPVLWCCKWGFHAIRRRV